MLQLHQNLMASPLHRANILNETFRYIGIGVARSDGRVWITQIFFTAPETGAPPPVKVAPTQGATASAKPTAAGPPAASARPVASRPAAKVVPQVKATPAAAPPVLQPTPQPSTTRSAAPINPPAATRPTAAASGAPQAGLPHTLDTTPQKAARQGESSCVRRRRHRLDARPSTPRAKGTPEPLSRPLRRPT